MNKFITLSHLRRVVSAITNRFKSLENTVEDIEETKADISYVDSKPGVMKVTVTGDEDNGYSADKTFAEIYAHIQNGGSVYMHYEGTAYKLLGYGPESIIFSSGSFEHSYDGSAYKHTLGFPAFGIDRSNMVYSIQNNIIYMESARLNGSTNYSPTFYAPTTVGTSGQVLTSSGSGAPTWSNISTPSAATATPLMDGTAAVGSSSKYAKEDHVHPSDTSKLPIRTIGSGGTQEAIFTNGGTYWRVEQIGSGDSTSRASINGSGGTVTLSSSTGSGSNATNNIISITPSTTSISKIPTPTGDTDAANKKYVDDSISGFSSSLSGLTDTTISSPTNGQILTYDSTNSVWVNEDVPSEVMVVNVELTYDSTLNAWEASSDKTYSQIYSHLSGGGDAYCIYDDGDGSVYLCDLNGFSESDVSFIHIGFAGTYTSRRVYWDEVVITASGVNVSGGDSLIPSKTSQITNDSGFVTTDTNTTYTFSMTNNVITLTGSDGSTSSVTLPVYGGEVDAVWEGGSY